MPGGGRVGQEDRGAGPVQRLRLPARVLRLVLGGAQRHDDRELPAIVAGGGDGRGDRRGQLGGRVRVGAVPEHHVEQQHAAPRVRGLGARSGRSGCAGRSSGAPGPGSARRRRSPASGARRPAGPPRRPTPGAAGCWTGCRRARPPRSASPRRRACRRRTDRAARRRGVGAGWPSQDHGSAQLPPTASTACRATSVRSLVWPSPGPSRASRTGVPSDPAYDVISAATAGSGGLDTSTISSVAGSSSSRASAARVDRPRTAADRSRPPTPRQWLTPTSRVSSMHMTCWAPVPLAATSPTGPGRTALAKPSPTPPTTAVPQSGPITSRPRAAASSLSRTSASTGTLSLKTSTDRPAPSASIASVKACGPGTETRARSAPPVRRAADATVRGAGPSPPSPSPPVEPAEAAARACSSAASARSAASSSVSAHRDDQVVRPGVGRRREAHAAQQVEVELGAHRDLAPPTPRRRPARPG